MKYLKHFYVSESGIVYNSKESRPTNEGYTHPDIDQLDVKFWLQNADGVPVMFSTVPEEVNFSNPGATELSKVQWEDEIEVIFERIKQERIHELFTFVNTLKVQVIDYWWHHSEITAAMSVKVVEAQAADSALTENDAGIVAPLLKIEATARNITVKDLASRILSHHNGLLTAEAVVSGHRGLLSDMIDSMTMDKTDVDSIMASFDSLYNFDITQGFSTIMQQLGLV